MLLQANARPDGLVFSGFAHQDISQEVVRITHDRVYDRETLFSGLKRPADFIGRVSGLLTC